VGKEYRRVQIGVGRPEHKDQVESYVLSKFVGEEFIWFNMLVEVLAEKVTLLVRGEDRVFEDEVSLAMSLL
jgi:PTH1 family peptidyl-tRNA hydrolase